MRIPNPPSAARLREAPGWRPVFASRGPGAASALHAHHGMHVVLACRGETCESGPRRAGRGGARPGW